MGTGRLTAGTRTVTVAVLVTGALAAVLIAWFSAGWRSAQHDRAALEARVLDEATEAADEAAAAVIARLEELRATESQRPYYHYQNLFHDPRGASEGRAVVPSPLAGGPEEPLVALHFQIDGAGRVSAPTVNREVPEVGGGREQDRLLLAGIEKVRTEVVTPGDPVQIAMATPAPVPAEDAPAKNKARTTRKKTDSGVVAALDGEADDERMVASAEEGPSPADLVASLDGLGGKGGKPSTAKRARKPGKSPPPEPKEQVVALDPDAYAQNVTSNQIFVEAKQRRAQGQQQVLEPPQQQASLDDADDQQVQAPLDDRVQAPAPPVTTPPQRAPPAPRPAPARAATPPPAPGPVFITVAPLGWRAASIDGEPALLAVRQVTTPDGVLTQGLIVDRAKIEGWLAERGGAVTTVASSVAALPGAASAAVGLGGVRWWVTVDASGALAAARTAGDGLERAFLGRFVPVSALALLCAVLVVLLTARAERLARQRARFAAAAAHELRTPLAGIQLYGDMLVDGLGDPKRHRDYARRVAEEASRLGRVVANVLGFSQLERGSLHVRPEPADLSAAVQAIVERAEPGLLRGGATVELEAPPGIRARFDADALARIVGNLLDNAEKYSREHEDRTIAVTVRPGPTHAEIEVVDHGPGLPAALRKRRFRPFTRGTGDDGPPGLGLGLALSQNLATAMGGSLTWRDQERGAAFVVAVPRAADV